MLVGLTFTACNPMQCTQSVETQRQKMQTSVQPDHALVKHRKTLFLSGTLYIHTDTMILQEIDLTNNLTIPA